MYDYDSCSEIVLVKRAKKQDTKAFSKLYETVYQDMYHYALYMLKHSQDAEDVVSATVISAFENIVKLRKDERFRSWIFKILTNQCKRKLMANHRQIPTDEEPDLLVHHDFSATHDVKEALSELSDEERLIISLSVFCGYNSKEIGEQLSLNPNTVRSKRSRALGKMEGILQG